MAEAGELAMKIVAINEEMANTTLVSLFAKKGIKSAANQRAPTPKIKVMNNWPNEFHLMLLICFLSSFRYNSAPAAKAINPREISLIYLR